MSFLLGLQLAILNLPRSMGAGIAESNLPIMLIDTRGVPMPLVIEGQEALAKLVEVNGTMYVWDDGKPANQPKFWSMSISYHGQSTLAVYPKKPYGITVLEEFASTESLDIPLMGLPTSAHWILKAPYGEQSLMRDNIVSAMANNMGLYTPGTQFFELYLNDDGDTEIHNRHYKGVYVLMEKIERGEYHVDIPKHPNKETDPSQGGYILKVDKADPEDPVLNTTRKTLIQVSYPKKKSITPAQTTFARSIMQTLEDTLQTPSLTLDPVNGYKNYIHMRSWIDYFIVSEMAVSVDGYRYSVFLNWDKNGGLRMGPPWDYNLCFGMTGYVVDPTLSAASPTGWRYEWEYKQNRPTPDAATWYVWMLSDPQFRYAVQDRWWDLRQSGVISLAWFQQYVDTQIALLDQGVQQRNFAKWPTFNLYLWPYRPQPTPPSWREEISVLLDWVRQRIEWLDGAFTRGLWHTNTGVGTTCAVNDDGGEYCFRLKGQGCTPVNAPGYPECGGRAQWVSQHWRENPSYAAQGVDGSPCSIQTLLFNEGQCPPPPPGDENCLYHICTNNSQMDPPTRAPTPPPTLSPTHGPTPLTLSPTKRPTIAPSTFTPTTLSPTTMGPTLSPTTAQPTTNAPSTSLSPTSAPSSSPTASPTRGDSAAGGGGSPSTTTTTMGFVAIGAAIVVMLGAAVWCIVKRKKQHDDRYHPLIERGGIN